MRKTLAPIAALAALALAGCLSPSPIDESQFRGFCYQTDTGKELCDNVSICNQYLPIMNEPQQDQAQCLKACQDVDESFYMSNTMNACQNVVDSGRDWCQRYCRQTYPQK
jgi:hypothetical protein